MLVETARCGTLWVEDRRPDAPANETPVVLWHSVLCDGSMWSSVPDALLAAGHRVINVDAPGHGRSEPTRRPYTMDDSVDAALSVLDALGLERVVWCGLSWGGMVGMRLGIRAPERIEALVLIDTNADSEVPEKLPRYRVMTLVTRLLGPVPPVLARLPRIYFSPSTIDEKPAIVERFVASVASMDRQSILHVVDAVILGREDIRSQLHTIRAPTLVIVGAHDDATPIARSLDIAKRIEGARLVEIPRAGHLSTLEQPGMIADEILAFLAERRAAAA